MPIVIASAPPPAVEEHPYLGAEQALVTQWVLDQLASASADLDEIDDGLSLRVFEDFAPQGFSTYPFIIVQCQSPPRDVRGVGVSRVMVDTIYVVKAVAQVNSYAPLAPVARVIDQAMTTSVGGSLLGGNVFTSVRNDQFSLIEIDNGKQYRHFGGEYRIQAQG